MSHALCPCSPTQETLLVPKIVESPHYGMLNKDFKKMYINRSIAKLATKNKAKSKSSAMQPTPSAPQQDLSHPVVTFKTTVHPLLASSEIHSHIVFLHNQPTLT